MVAYAYNFSTWEVKSGGSGVQDHSQQHSRFKTNLGYVRTCLKAMERFKCLYNMFPTALGGISHSFLLPGYPICNSTVFCICLCLVCQKDLIWKSGKMGKTKREEPLIMGE